MSSEYLLSDDSLSEAGYQKKLRDSDYALTSLPLRHQFSNDIAMSFFWFAVFLAWPDSKERWTIQGVMVMAFYCFVGVLSVLAMVILLYSMFSVPTQILMLAFTTLAVFMQVVGAVFVLTSAYIRLGKACPSFELMYYKPALFVCAKFAGGFIIIAVIALVCLSADSIQNPAEASLGEVLKAGYPFNLFYIAILTSALLSISIEFFYVDTRAAASIVSELNSLARMQVLSVEVLSAGRNEIHRRVNDAYLGNTVMASAAFVNGAVFVLSSFINVATYLPHTTTVSYMGSLFSSISLLLKEVVYLVILLFEAARVNDAADKLCSELGTSTWDDEDKETRRMKLYISYTADPVSILVLGTRPTRYSVWIKLIGYCLTMAVGFMTQYVQQKLHT